MATILILDDEPSNLEIMAAILERQGHAILMASDAEEALAYSRAFPGDIDLVVADVVLRGRTAAEVANEIGRYRPDAQFLFVSGYPREALTDVFVSAGLGAHPPFLQKPFTLYRLVSKVNAVLETIAQPVGVA